MDIRCNHPDHFMFTSKCADYEKRIKELATVLDADKLLIEEATEIIRYYHKYRDGRYEQVEKWLAKVEEEK